MSEPNNNRQRLAISSRTRIVEAARKDRRMGLAAVAMMAFGAAFFGFLFFISNFASNPLLGKIVFGAACAGMLWAMLWALCEYAVHRNDYKFALELQERDVSSNPELEMLLLAYFGLAETVLSQATLFARIVAFKAEESQDDSPSS